MRFKHWKTASFFAISIASQIDARFDRLADRSNDRTINSAPNKDQFIDSLISKMSVSDLGRYYTHAENKTSSILNG